MSSDLFAAFGSAVSDQAPNVKSDHATSQPIEDPFDEDDFGDFEDASSPPVVQPFQKLSVNPKDQKSSENSRSLPTSHSAVHKSPPKGLTGVQTVQRNGSTAKAAALHNVQKDLFRPKPESEPNAEEQQGSGRHPFADHMDFLFDGGGDEYDAGDDDLEDLSRNPEAAMAYSKRLIAAQLERERGRSGGSIGENPWDGPVQTRHISAHPAKPPARAKDPNVLFDADDLSEDDGNAQVDEGDDFGEFEGSEDPHPVVTGSTLSNLEPIRPSAPISKSSASESKRKPPNSTPQTTLLDFDDNISTLVQGPPRNSTNFPTSPLPAKKKTAIEPQSQSFASRPMPTDEDAWDDFEEAEPTAPSAQNAATIRNNLPSSDQIPSKNTDLKFHGKEEDLLPPTNIPPPSVLLSLFPGLFNAAHETLFLPLSRLDPSQRHELLSHPATRQFLQSQIALVTVLGHITAGRKLRWKRDQFLAQGMRIGPAAAGGKSSGMKLAGVDKAEVTREDREVLDAIRTYKSQVGKLRAAVTTANAATSGPAAQAQPRLPPVPELAEQMPVQALKATQGGFTAPHACALCGLKREERVAKVDVDVDDSFGEWWVQGMNMHLSCQRFWNEYKGKLKSR